MSAVRPGRGVPPVTPVGLVAAISSVGWGEAERKGEGRGVLTTFHRLFLRRGV